MNVVAMPMLCLVGVLFLCFRTEATTFEIMREQAVKFQGALPCGAWNCDCLYKRYVGCCCVASRLTQLEDDTFKRMVNIWTSLGQLNNDISAFLGGIKVAFAATLKPPVFPERCFGPYTRNVPVPYNNVTLNDGLGYNPSLGTFTAQRSGLYSFSFTVYSNVETSGLRIYYMLQLMKNGEVATSAWEDNREDSEDSATKSVLLPMQVGDQVYVELLAGRFICNDNSHRNSFSGYLVYAYQEY